MVDDTRPDDTARGTGGSPQPSRSAHPINVQSIPLELRQRARWVAWRKTVRNGKVTKEPINPQTGSLAAVDKPHTWGTFAQAIRGREQHREDGVGFVLAADDPFAGVDLDGCRDPITGEVASWAHDIIVALNSYSEITPSSNGVHVWVKASLPPSGRKRGDIEMYDRDRFFTMTGHHVAGAPTTIEERQAEISALHARIFPATRAIPAPSRAESCDVTDAVLIERAMRARNGEKFRTLWTGNWTGYPSQSEADLALCTMLAFYTGGDVDRIDRLFRCSGLYRQKWDARRYGDGSTYGKGTIAKALA